MLKAVYLAILLAQTSPSVNAFRPVVSPSPLSSAHRRGKDSPLVLHAENGIWNTAGSFGKGKFRFYDGLDSYMKPFPDEDRELYPEMFALPAGVYEVPLSKPCGILFEEIEIGRGVFVQDLVEGGNAERQGALRRGDVLIGVTAIQVSGAKWERRMIPAKKFGFDMVVSAIGSNEEKYGCNNVIMMVKRMGEGDAEEVSKFMEFFEPPYDTPWKLPV